MEEYSQEQNTNDKISANDGIMQQNELLKKVVAEQQSLLKNMQEQLKTKEQQVAAQQNSFYQQSNAYGNNVMPNNYSNVQSQVQTQSQSYRRHIYKKQFAYYVSNALKVAAAMFAVFMLVLAIIMGIGSSEGIAGFVIFLIYIFIGFLGTVALLGTAAIIDTMIEIKEDLEDL